MCESWIADDIPSHFDIGGMVVGSRPGVAHLYMKQSGILAGLPFFTSTFASLPGCTVTLVGSPSLPPLPDASCPGSKYTMSPPVEGSFYEYSGKPILLAIVEGPLNQILRGERTALCALSRCSGVATDSRSMVSLGRSLKWRGLVAGTRKTTPGFRTCEKYGLMACGAGADAVMLDNMGGEEARECAREIKEKFKDVVVEVSGGITRENMGDYAGEFVDVISCGKLTQGYQCLDFSLKVQQE
ncbi:hypothetical protein TrRE_jg6756 [Triparma retinervis]|uniref:Quinolinate phosphoribosyl transferase C-terminal domain-containing protein n=1 Tax=Triparma retinervis TaxID=2557542 RepID=A0A9W7CCE8_9STRA|nr:hypothetical protein TrRE_jg6756 [Triparma retinervis]